MTKAWLRDLEERVREASGRLKKLLSENKKLRTENKKLRQRVRQLEERLATAAGDEDAAAWIGERDEIRRRTEKLVEHLDGLLKG